MQNKKVDLQADLLVQTLGFRLPSSAVAKTYDASGDVYVTVTTGTGNNSVDGIVKFVRASAPASGAYDALGLAQTVYSPHICQVLFDITASVGTTEAYKAQILCECARIGMKVELYEVDATGSNIAVAGITSANFITSFGDVQWADRASV